MLCLGHYAVRKIDDSHDKQRQAYEHWDETVLVAGRIIVALTHLL